MNILILLPGTVAKTQQELDQSGKGITIDEKSVNLYLPELVNNFSTVEALKKSYPEINITVRHVTDRKNPLTLINQILKLNRYINRKHVQLVHQFWGGPSAFLISLFIRKPYILSVLGSDLMGSYTSSGVLSKKGMLLQKFTRLASIKADQVIVMSKRMLDLLPSSAKPKASIIPESLRELLFYPFPQESAKKQLGWTPSKKYVLFFNNGQPVKNLSLAKKVFKLASLEMDSLEFFEVNNIPQHKLYLYYNAAEVLLITSLHEGSNNSIKEAMACNCPVLTVPAGDAEERLSNVSPGYVSRSYDANEMASNLLKIIRTGKRSNGREYISPFLPHTTSSLIYDVYKKTIRQ